MVLPANARTKRPSATSSSATPAYSGVYPDLAGWGVDIERCTSSSRGWVRRYFADRSSPNALDLIKTLLGS